MTLVARYATEVDGHIYAKGDRLDWSGGITPRIAANFRREDGSRVETTAEDAGTAKGTGAERKTDAKSRADVIARTIASMKRDGICRTLDGMGITYSPKSSTEYLARLLLVNRGEMEE